MLTSLGTGYMKWPRDGASYACRSPWTLDVYFHGQWRSRVVFIRNDRVSLMIFTLFGGSILCEVRIRHWLEAYEENVTETMFRVGPPELLRFPGMCAFSVLFSVLLLHFISLVRVKDHRFVPRFGLHQDT